VASPQHWHLLSLSPQQVSLAWQSPFSHELEGKAIMVFGHRPSCWVPISSLEFCPLQGRARRYLSSSADLGCQPRDCVECPISVLHTLVKRTSECSLSFCATDSLRNESERKVSWGKCKIGMLFAHITFGWRSELFR
jgi:hypothetical protein